MVEVAAVAAVAAVCTAHRIIRANAVGVHTQHAVICEQIYGIFSLSQRASRPTRALASAQCANRSTLREHTNAHRRCTVYLSLTLEVWISPRV